MHFPIMVRYLVSIFFTSQSVFWIFGSRFTGLWLGGSFIAIGPLDVTRYVRIINIGWKI